MEVACGGGARRHGRRGLHRTQKRAQLGQNGGMEMAGEDGGGNDDGIWRRRRVNALALSGYPGYEHQQHEHAA
eukprot:8724920-Lingulodinium_polyedra.AAC.1